MALSEDQKLKMREGRTHAALARKQAADATVLPAGATRNEQRAINKDALDQRIETRESEAGIESIDQSKFRTEDNEIQRHVRRRDKTSGVPIKGMQPGKRYAWLTLGSSHGDSARANIRQMNADAKMNGYKPVEGDNPAGKEFAGNDGMAGTTGRGVGDVYLAEIREEDYQELIAEDEEKRERQGAVEDRSVVYAAEKLGRAGLGNTMHNITDANDSFVRSRISESERSPVIMRSTVTEGDLRRGSMRGPGGRIMQPGFERRM
jgi:hypothetical protein